MNDLPDNPRPDRVEDPHAGVAETGDEVDDTVEEVAAVKEQAKHQMQAAGDEVQASTEHMAEVAAGAQQAAPAPV